MQRSGTVTVNYAIPEDLHFQLKVMAAQHATTLKAVILAALEEYVDRHAGENQTGPEQRRRSK